MVSASAVALLGPKNSRAQMKGNQAMLHLTGPGIHFTHQVWSPGVTCGFLAMLPLVVFCVRLLGLSGNLILTGTLRSDGVAEVASWTSARHNNCLTVLVENDFANTWSRNPGEAPRSSGIYSVFLARKGSSLSLCWVGGWFDGRHSNPSLHALFTPLVCWPGFAERCNLERTMSQCLSGWPPMWVLNVLTLRHCLFACADVG